MKVSSVDLKVALRALAYQRELLKKRLRRHELRLLREHRFMFEARSIESTFIIISDNIRLLRKQFERLQKMEKRLLREQERTRHPQDHSAGRNQGGFSKINGSSRKK